MITLHPDPLLGDFLYVCMRLPEDERAQLSALTGYDYDIDGAAIGNFTVQGPKWVARLEDGAPVAIGGFVEQRPGVLRDFMLTTPEAWKYGFQLTRICRKVMDAMMTAAHRIETIVPASRLSSRPELERWYKVLGYNKEALLYGYCADGADAWTFSRVKH